MLRLAGEKREDLRATTATAAQTAAEEGAAGQDRYYYVSPRIYSDAPPCAYVLSDDEYRDVQGGAGSARRSGTSSDGSWTIPTSQAEQPMVGLLLDERAPHELVSGEPFPVDIAATVGTPARLPYGSDIKLATTPFR